MRRLLYIMLAILLLTGCEVIPEAERLVPLPIAADTTGGAHLLMEFTGFRCVNCPTAAAAAEALQQTYGSRLVIVAMHPASNPFTQGVAQYDYTCPAADTYYRQLGGNASTPFPTGNVDGIAISGNYLYDYQEWPALLAERMSRTAEVHLSATAESRDNEVQISVSYYADSDQDATLHLWLVEDSICGAQAMPDGSVNTAYYHRHVLRDAWRDAEGETLHLRAVPATMEATMPLPEACDWRRCSIVAVLADNKDRQLLNVTQIQLQ